MLHTALIVVKAYCRREEGVVALKGHYLVWFHCSIVFQINGSLNGHHFISFFLFHFILSHQMLHTALNAVGSVHFSDSSFL